MATKLFLKHYLRNSYILSSRKYADCKMSKNKGLILAAYDGCNPNEYILTPTGRNLDETVYGAISDIIDGTFIKKGSCIVLQNVLRDYFAVAVCRLGKDVSGYDKSEALYVCKEQIRTAVGNGTKQLQDMGVGSILVESANSSEAAAEGSILAAWLYQELKNKDDQLPFAKLRPYREEQDGEGWKIGEVKAEAQNAARNLEATPPNLMTPSGFCQSVIDTVEPCGIKAEVRDKDWIQSKKMDAFLTVAKGSCEPPLLLELSYCGGAAKDKPVVLVGKGVTFDTGGLCTKPSEDSYASDLAGAAVVAGVFKAVAMMSLPINLRGIMPLCENMLGGMSLKPKDVVTCMNGKTIHIEDTDNEGRVMLADAISYSKWFKPCMVMNISTSTGGLKKTLGAGVSGVFSTSESAWKELERAGAETGDRMWRFPLWKYYKSKIRGHGEAEITNVGKITGMPCIVAAFLREFAPPVDFVHIDISGTGHIAEESGHSYLRKGMATGRPTRTIAQFLYQMCCPFDKGDETC